VTGKGPRGKGFSLNPASRADCAFWLEVQGRPERRGEVVVLKAGRSLEAKRDFLDVRDMAEAYARAMTIRTPGTHLFNVGTGRAVAIDEILNDLLSLARIPVRAELDPERVRTGVPLTLTLDSTRFRTATGWAPRIDLRTSLRDLLDYWRVQVRQEARV